MDDAIRDFLLTLLRDAMNVPIPADVDGRTPLGVDGLNLDSIVILELFIRAEDEYDINIINFSDGVFPTSFGELVERIETAREA